MKRKIILLSLMLLLITCPALADFVNGGFEDGTFNGWTKDGGRFTGTYNFTGDPGKSAIVGVGTDPIAGIPTVSNGQHAARINNSDNGFHFSTITQSVVWNDPKIFFAWAAVLEEPGHNHNVEPNFSVKLTDTTTSTVLYDIFFASDTIPAGLLHTVNVGFRLWKYTDWQVVDLDTSAVLGHTLELTLLAADCGLGAHGGYAYLDGFGAVDPDGIIPVPSTLLLLGSGLAGLLAYGRIKLTK
jgi:hypothetical protein